jgi:hypothetical protein
MGRCVRAELPGEDSGGVAFLGGNWILGEVDFGKFGEGGELLESINTFDLVVDEEDLGERGEREEAGDGGVIKSE